MRYFCVLMAQSAHQPNAGTWSAIDFSGVFTKDA